MNPSHKAILKELQNRSYNKVCADCKAINPCWASANLGIFLCIRCAGIHRALGTHISFVRSTNLDNWKDKHIEIMRKVGNGNAMEYYEYHKPLHIEKPGERAPNDRVKEYIVAKYVRRIWMKRPEDDKVDHSKYESDDKEEFEELDEHVEKYNPSENFQEPRSNTPTDTKNDSLLSFEPELKQDDGEKFFLEELLSGIGENEPLQVSNEERTNNQKPIEQEFSLSNLLMGLEETTQRSEEKNGVKANGIRLGSSVVENAKEKVMKYFDQPQQQRYPLINTNNFRTTTTTIPRHHQNLSFSHTQHRQTTTISSFDYIPKGRSVPLNFRNNHSNHNTQMNFMREQNQSKANSFF